MKHATSEMRLFAQCLIALDARSRKSSGSKNPGAFQVCEKLRPQLATLVGNEAFRALLAHALALARAETPGLRAVQVKTDGTLEMSEEIHAQINADKFFEGRVVLVAHLLSLLVAFIGENLTVQLVRQIWPKVPLNILELENGDKK